jgi:hypothetical protein
LNVAAAAAATVDNDNNDDDRFISISLELTRNGDKKHGVDWPFGVFKV